MDKELTRCFHQLLASRNVESMLLVRLYLGIQVIKMLCVIICNLEQFQRTHQFSYRGIAI